MDIDELQRLARGWGAHAVGVADVGALRGLPAIPPNLLDGYARAISIGVAVPYGAFATITDAPTTLYLHHYSMVNMLLDLIALRAFPHGSPVVSCGWRVSE